MLPQKKNKILFNGLLLSLILVICSCSNLEQTTGIPEINIPKKELSYTKGQQFISVKAQGKWEIQLRFEGETSWASLDKSSGSGSQNKITLSWDQNPGTTRSFTLSLVSGNLVNSVIITQLPYSNTGSGSGSGEGGDHGDEGDEGGSGSGEGGGQYVPANRPNWLELPAASDSKLAFISHDMKIGSNTTRNYSYDFDREAHLARWVAYPLYSACFGGSGRTNDWNYDPKIEAKYQPNLSGGYNGYDRGHQLPSHDRTVNKAANSQTFYYTNMTPQLARFNQDAWAKLENKVSEWGKSLDTLYVVTGVDLNGASKYADDKSDKKCIVPSGYYKALLGYKKGGSVSNATGGYIGIAFYFKHEANNSSISTILNQKMTIDALEQKMGLDFFVNLPNVIGESKANTVESTVHSWWD